MVMCNYCKPFSGRMVRGLNGAIRACVSYAEEPEPLYTVDVEHWESSKSKDSVHFRKVRSAVELRPNFCPVCGRELRGEDDG